jgi:hypothetical protein
MNLTYSRSAQLTVLAICIGYFCLCTLAIVVGQMDPSELPFRPGRKNPQLVFWLATPIWVIGQVQAVCVFGRTLWGMLKKRPAVVVERSGITVDRLCGVIRLSWPEIQSIRTFRMRAGAGGVDLLEIRRTNRGPVYVPAWLLAPKNGELTTWIDKVASYANTSAALWSRSARHQVSTRNRLG